MRTMSYALSVLLASPASLFAQADQRDSGEASGKAIIAECAITQCILSGAPVVNAPFAAEATTVWRPPATSGQPELRATARYYRDSAGRVRVEQSFAGHDVRPQQIILTPEADSTYVLDPVARTVTPVPRGLAQMMVGGGGYNQFVLPLSKRRFIGFFQLPAGVESTSAIGEESLGQRSMAGIQVTGTSFATRLPTGLIGNGRGERWISPELKLVVYSRSEDSHIGIVEYQLTTISRSDPRAELFEVPQDHAATSAKGPLTWESPYAPKGSDIP